MDRPVRVSVACGFGLLLTLSGCRTPRAEVPPGRPFTKDGAQQKAIEFSSEGHPANGAATANFMPNNLGGSNLGAGIGAGESRPNPSAFGAPGGAYGGPGTAGLAQPPGVSDPNASRASTAPGAMPPLDSPPLDSAPAGMPPVGAPPGPDLNVTPPSRSTRPMPSQTVQPSIDTPGQVGTPDQSPQEDCKVIL